MILRPEIELLEGDRFSSTLATSESALFTFHVPSDPTIRSVSITLTLGTLNTTKVRMFVVISNEASVVPSSSNSIRVVPSWLGLSARVYDSDGANLFCIGCTFRILVTSEVNTNYILSSHTSKGFTIIKERSIDVYEIIKRDERNCYRYNVKSPEDSLEIYLNAYSGNPNIYANPLTLPSDMTEFKFQSKGEINEILSITSEQRGRVNALTGNYYICVFGEAASSYNLMIYSETPNTENRIPIYSALTRTMSVKENKRVIFEFKIEKKELTSITFTLTSISGNADLYIKQCKYDIDIFGEDINRCNLPKEEFDSPGVMRSTSTSSVDSLSIEFNPSSCSGKNIRCSYLIVVYGVEDSHFSLSLLADRKVEVPLAEGIPSSDSVGLHQYSYFSFIVNDPQTTNVKIQLTSLSGDSDLLVSRNSPFCDVTKAEKMSSQESLLPDIVTFTKEKDGLLNSTYHISVFGFTVSAFTITYSTTNPSNLPSSILLLDGRPQFTSLNDSDTSALFRFQIYFPHNMPKDIRVFLFPLSGRYNVYAGVDYIPTATNFSWQAQELDSSIYIGTADHNYRSSGTYYLLVLKAQSENLTPHLFSVKYTTGNYIASIMEGFPEIGNLTKNDFAYYKYYVTNFDGKITVSLTPFSGDPDLFISINSSRQMPTVADADYFSTTIGIDTIDIPLEEVMKKNKECHNLEKRECGIYIGVKCYSNDCSYSLQVIRGKSVAIHLTEGIPQFAEVKPDNPKYFSYALNSLNVTTIISVQPKKGKLKAYANFIPLKYQKTANESHHFPTPSKHDISFVSRANSEIATISQELSPPCGQFCFLYIGVYLDPDAPHPESSDFSIVAMNNFQVLIDGETLVDFIASRTYNYYRFHVSCTDCTLSISLTPLSAGDPDLYVNYGRYQFPAIGIADFYSTSLRGDFLQISPNDQYFVHNNKKIQGEYTIAVYGYDNCTYTIAATTSPLIELSLGIPMLQEQPENEIKYFSFKSWKNEDISIKLRMHSGRVLIRANVINNTKEVNLVANLPKTEDLSKWSSKKNNTNNQLIISKDSISYLYNGVFLIAVETFQAASYDIVIEYSGGSESSFISNGQPYRSKIRSKDSLRLSFIASSSEDIKFTLDTIYGDVEADVTCSENPGHKWKLAAVLPLTIYSSESSFRIGTYYITINATSDAEIVLTAEQNPHYVSLTEGQPQTGILLSNSYVYFLYTKFPQLEGNDTYRFNIIVKINNPVADAAIILKETSQKVFSFPTLENWDYIIKYDPELNQLGASIVMNKTNTRNIAIAITANLTSHVHLLKFEVVAWTTGIVTMMPMRKYVNTLDSTHDNQIYELNIDKPSKLYIEVIPCVGEVEFIVTKNLAGINDRKYDLKKAELSKGRLFGSLETVPGTYYVCVRAVTFGKDEALYSIRSILSNATETEDLEDYYLENYGNIDFTIDGQDIYLKWGSTIRKKGKTGLFDYTRYSVYVGQEGGNNMATSCGMKLGKTEQIARDLVGTSFTWRVRDDLLEKKIGFNVMATETEYLQSFAYNPFYVQIARPRGTRRIMGGMLIRL